jgi:hypothetical protein
MLAVKEVGEGSSSLYDLAGFARRGGFGTMGMIAVEIWDATGSKRQPIEVPDDAPMNRILAVLLEKMNFPQFAPDGQPLSYKFHHRSSGKQLLDEQCLSDVGARPGDILRLQPEITAGAASNGSITARRPSEVGLFAVISC